MSLTELGVLNRQAPTGPVTDRGSEIIHIGPCPIFTPGYMYNPNLLISLRAYWAWFDFHARPPT